jgi:hypothetical protein
MRHRGQRARAGWRGGLVRRPGTRQPPVDPPIRRDPAQPHQAPDIARAEPGDAFGRVFLGQRVGHVIGDAQARRVPPAHDLSQLSRRAEVAVGAVLQRDRDAQPGRAGHQTGQPLVEHRAGGVVRGRRQRVPPPGHDHDEVSAEVRGQLDLGEQLALADLPDLRVGADQVDVHEARVDRNHPQPEAAQQADQRMPFVAAEVPGEQVRRRRGQLHRADALPAQRPQRIGQRRPVQPAERAASQGKLPHRSRSAQSATWSSWVSRPSRSAAAAGPIRVDAPARNLSRTWPGAAGSRGVPSA